MNERWTGLERRSIGKRRWEKSRATNFGSEKPGCDRQTGRYRIRPSGTRYHPYILIRNPKATRWESTCTATPRPRLVGAGDKDAAKRPRSYDTILGDLQKYCLLCVSWSYTPYLLEASKRWPHRARLGDCPIVRRHYHLAPQGARGPARYQAYEAVPDDNTAPGNCGRYRRSMIRYLTTTTRHRLIAER
ncbi:uncharacterized protein BO80DRAFT_49039 [Aspergillus ibericus CBS 121593]|uniref:Uncharacterized protein n=1 Tax=Aspergillus ibericus CBS 121593 TaxID=1448316 RepID=A0A395H2L4_9EURO|nr:hypothetical protein BO80DRAFT_49039 [Aspergillus ibericus CBS 121593]RAL01996.1 hypothetical protein BO80DRAFT_49039 [Aspergillus ibericus CBS 121593]